MRKRLPLGTSIFGRHLILSILVTCLFVVSLGYLSLWSIRQYQREAVPYSPPAVTFAKLLESIPREDRMKTLQKINDTNPNSHYQFWLFDGTGKVLFPEGTALPTEVDLDDLPNDPLDYQSLERSPGDRASYVVVKNPGEPTDYLLVKILRASGNYGRRMYLINFGSLLLSVILGTTISFFLLFYSLRQKAALVDDVISELQKGNLKARFPITKMDEIGEAMLRFNKMADEIERLVEQLKSTEKTRMSMLSELAHDLRTPVASLKSMLETLNTDRPLSVEIRAELTALSLKEVDYFAHLVEDLLFLAQAGEPRYHSKTETVDLRELIDSEIESVEKVNNVDGGRISVKGKFQTGDFMVSGDSHLLRRLFRNALDNAVAFAKKEVVVAVQRTSDSHVEICVQDDGAGFSATGLQEFGQKKMSRRYSSPSQRRASIGLGSVIMSTVAALHRGEVRAINRKDESGNVLGAEVRVILPLM